MVKLALKIINGHLVNVTNGERATKLDEILHTTNTRQGIWSSYLTFCLNLNFTFSYSRSRSEKSDLKMSRSENQRVHFFLVPASHATMTSWAKIFVLKTY